MDVSRLREAVDGVVPVVAVHDSVEVEVETSVRVDTKEAIEETVEVKRGVEGALVVETWFP